VPAWALLYKQHIPVRGDETLCASGYTPGLCQINHLQDLRSVHKRANDGFHEGILPLPEAPALVRGSSVSFSRWCSCSVLSLTVYSGVWSIG
jgi:hypothetical protein